MAALDTRGLWVSKFSGVKKKRTNLKYAELSPGLFLSMSLTEGKLLSTRTQKYNIFQNPHNSQTAVLVSLMYQPVGVVLVAGVVTAQKNKTKQKHFIGP